MPDLIQTLRTMSRPRAAKYAEGLLSMLAWNPSLRRHYALADLAFVESLCKDEKRLDYAKAAGEPYKFSSTQINIADNDEELDKQLLAMAKEVPDGELADDGREDQMHITVKYGLHTQDAEEVRELIEEFGPIRVTLGSVSIFPAKDGKEYDVVKVDVTSDDLARLNHFIGKRLECTTTHADYKPHITLAYVKAEGTHGYGWGCNGEGVAASEADGERGERVNDRCPVAPKSSSSDFIRKRSGRSYARAPRRRLSCVR